MNPPDYVQNPYVDGTAEQRMRKESLVEQERVEEGGIWGGVRRLAGGVGEKLSELEREAWKWAKGM
jgi:hypothetical protein